MRSVLIGKCPDSCSQATIPLRLSMHVCIATNEMYLRHVLAMCKVGPLPVMAPGMAPAAQRLQESHQQHSSSVCCCFAVISYVIYSYLAPTAPSSAAAPSAAAPYCFFCYCQPQIYDVLIFCLFVCVGPEGCAVVFLNISLSFSAWGGLCIRIVYSLRGAVFMFAGAVII